MRRQRAEGAVDQLTGCLGIDIADDGDGQLVAREGARDVGAHVVGGDALHRVGRAVALAAVRVAGESRAPPGVGGQAVGIDQLALPVGQFLAAHALDRVGGKTRLREREPEQVEGLVAVLVERAQRAAEIIARGAKRQFDGVALEPLVESLAVEVAGALVEHVGGEMGGAGLVGIVLGRAAVERVAERDQRHRVFGDQPGLDAGRADDRLDGHGGRRRGERQKAEGGGENRPDHERFSACGLVSLIR